ncbi:protein of unknown function [Shewanella benthica]|uniref:Uncharacterized protein n=1 Tax=Shewanella benthica TaxID=43661 RepID=A0A330M655_9GAMM|nr:protein of unknown function [Shewanella benthica]
MSYLPIGTFIFKRSLSAMVIVRMDIGLLGLYEYGNTLLTELVMTC